MMLQAADISVSFNGVKLLNDISVDFSAGSLTGILGPNGAGKSTLLRVLAGLQKTDAGVVSLQGKELHSTDETLRAQTLSYLPQATESHWPLTVERIVSLGRSPFQKGGVLEAEDIRAIELACQQTDISHLLGRPINQLSGGEKARVMLARALATQADVLLADEPVASLDPRHQLEIMLLLESLAKAGKTIVVVLHELHLAVRFCNQLVLLNKGQKVCAGEPSAVLSQQNLQDAYAIETITGQHQGQNWLLPWNIL